tara:strand:+ start:21 stop:185 length:165 start_codon:yes stop_codon:yes gene_type:complete
MKKQNDPKKTKHHKIYEDTRPTYIRHKEAVESIPKRCWWIRDYLKGIYTYRGKK